MGHDIYGFKNKKELHKTESCYLRRSMWSRTIHFLYAAMGVPEYNGEVSGTGKHKEFSLEELTTAYNNLEKVSKELSAEDKLDYFGYLQCLIDTAKANESQTVIAYFG